MTDGNITVSAGTVTFQGCDFNSSLPGATDGPEIITLTGSGPYLFEFCSIHGSDGTGATRMDEAIAVAANSNVTVQFCNIYYMRNAVNLYSNITAGVTIQNNYFHDIVMYDSAAPAVLVTTAATGGNIAAGTYLTQVTYTGSAGESLPSPSIPVVTTGATSTITITSPPASTLVGGATNWYAYVTQNGGATYYRQQTSGSPTALATNLTLTSGPVTNQGQAPDTDHSECVYFGAVGGGTNITVTGNTMLNPLNQTAALYLHTNYPFGSVTVTGNLFGGGGYAVYTGGAASTAVTFQNNVFTTAYGTASGEFGAAYPSVHPDFGSAGNVWQNNTWLDGPAAGVAISAP